MQFVMRPAVLKFLLEILGIVACALINKAIRRSTYSMTYLQPKLLK